MEPSQAAPANDAYNAGNGLLARLAGRGSKIDGNELRAAVLGANDGLVSNLSLVMGVAGAALEPHAILVTGLAGLLAGACSMAMGEWLSVNTARESNARRIALEAEQLRRAPAAEKKDVARIYEERGLSEAQATALADKLLSNKDTALDTLAREELGIDPEELGGSPWQAAITSFFLFAAGAIFPVAPFFVLHGLPAVGASLASSGFALFVIGAGTSLFTGRGVLFSGVRQLAIGFAAAAVTYGIGHLIGVTISG